MRCVRFFHDLSPRGTLFLIGDIGTAREDDLGDRTAGGISADSNFWLSVNFHALGQFIQSLGGKVLHPPSRHVHLNISTFILGHSATDFAEAGLAYDEAIGQTGPDDLAVTTRMLANQAESMNRGQLLAFLRSTAYDPDYFVRCLPLLLDSLPDVSWPGASDIRDAAQQAWEAYYPMGNTDDISDLPAGLGVLLYTIGDYAEALEFFLRSLELVGMDTRTTFNVALCLNRLGRSSEAMEWLDRTLELDPGQREGPGNARRGTRGGDSSRWALSSALASRRTAGGRRRSAASAGRRRSRCRDRATPCECGSPRPARRRPPGRFRTRPGSSGPARGSSAACPARDGRPRRR